MVWYANDAAPLKLLNLIDQDSMSGIPEAREFAYSVV